MPTTSGSAGSPRVEVPTFRVMALHALVYCERLFYLEEVEEIRVADASVWAGRRLHQELDEPTDVITLTMESQELGIRGRTDAVRRRDGTIYPIEHKRGRSHKDTNGAHQAWESDRIQALAIELARRLIAAKLELQLRHVLRSSRKDAALRERVDEALARLRLAIKGVSRAPDRDTIMGHEGAGARAYFQAVLGAVNRRTFDPDEHFAITGEQVWLSEPGRRRMIAAYEQRKHAEYRHPSVGYTLSYARMIELEVRLLEKEWSGEPGLFARLRIR